MKVRVIFVVMNITKAVEKTKLGKNSVSYESCTYDLGDTGAALYQLS